MRLAPVALLVLAGCATVDDVRQFPAESVHYSEKPAAEIAECVHDAWQNVTFFGAPYEADVSRLGQRYTVAVTPASPSELADIITEGERTRVEFRHGRMIGAIRWTKYRDAMVGCL